MRKALKNAIKFLCALVCLGVSRIVRKRPPRVVLYYHGVTKAFANNFRRQMAYLARACSVVKPCEIRQANSDGRKPIVAVTFDDAFENLMENAIPILREYGLPAAIFVPTGRIGLLPNWTMAPGCPDKDEIVMSEQQIVALDREGFDIFSHAISHRPLTDVNDTDLDTELIQSKRDLEKILGHEVPAVSYPHGACDDRVDRATRRAGYTFGFTISPNIVDNSADPLRIGRFKVFPHDSLFVFKLKAKGACQFDRTLMNLKRLIKNNLRRN